MSSGQLLSTFLLAFNDQDLLRIYQREKVEFFNKAAPIITTLIFLLAATLEIIYRAIKIGNLPIYITILNWSVFGVFLIISLLHRRLTDLHKLVCPGLTVLVYLYLSFLDYDYTLGSIYYS